MKAGNADKGSEENRGPFGFSSPHPWNVPPDLFAGRACFVLGGGPSLKGFDAAQLRGRGAIIAINNAAFRLAPWADMMFFADQRWIRWNYENVRELWDGGLIVSRHDPQFSPVATWPIKILKPNRQIGLSLEPDTVAGICGGANSLNIAFLAGAAPIVLLGYDGRDSGNWHDEHKSANQADTYWQLRPAMERMAAELERRKVDVINCTPGTAYECFPKKELADVLQSLPA